MDTSPAVRKATLRLYECMSTGDVRGIERMFSRQLGVVGIGTDPNEWWVGHETLVRVLTAQLRELGGKMPIEPGDLVALAEGAVGWVADRATCRLPDGSALPLRLTVVFHQEGGEWKIVQLHTSVGVSSVDAVGTELSTK